MALKIPPDDLNFLKPGSNPGCTHPFAGQVSSSPGFFDRMPDQCNRNQNDQENKSQRRNSHHGYPSPSEIPAHRTFNRSAIRYMLGRINKVMKKANARPNMMVQESGFQNTALSPPKNICGFRSANRVTKLILNPTAKGINASIAASAVSNTGMILCFTCLDQGLPCFHTALTQYISKFDYQNSIFHHNSCQSHNTQSRSLPRIWSCR